MNRKTLIGLLFASVWLVTSSCSDNENKKFSPQIYNISGKVEKGPFISGSTIDLQPLDASMHALGTTYSSIISDHSGKFSFESKELDVPFAQLTANGYFFNEVNGDLSKGTITLRAVVNLTNQSTVNVNLLTHLKYHRILNLIKKGKSFDEANSQSQQELLTAFGLQRFANTDVSQYSIASGTDEAGALIAISSLLIVNKTEAELTEYLARLSEEFGLNGIFSETTKQQFKQDRNSLNSRLSNIENYIISRYSEKLNMTVSVKDLSHFFDWDDDGIAGNEITDDNNPVTLEKSEINVPKEGGQYSIRINSSIPLSLTTDLNGTNYPSLDEYYKLYRTGSISHEEKLENQTLNIVIQPASNKRMNPTNIYIYDYRGEVAASLAVKQEGDPTGKLLTDNGEAIIANIASSFSQAIGICNQMDARYTGQIVDQYFMPPVSSDNTNLNKCWLDLYSAINKNINLLSIDKNQGELLQASLKTLNALCYYNLISYWGDVPYRTIENSSNFSLPRTSTNTILGALTTDLKNAITNLTDKKNIFGTNAEGFIFFSKDLPRIVLANIYMCQGNYREAKVLLNAVVSNGYYQLENTIEYSSDSKDLIFGVYSANGGRNTSTILPILTYTDVVLSLAECELSLGNEDSAENYLKSVANKKGISISTNLKEGIKTVRKQALQQCGGYFAFLKRNDIAIFELDLENYQLLLPIPKDEMCTNPSISQNPSYS